MVSYSLENIGYHLRQAKSALLDEKPVSAFHHVTEAEYMFKNYVTQQQSDEANKKK